MFSLLPEQYKKDIKKEYSFRRLSLVFGFIGILAVVAIVVYVPFFLLAQMEKDSLQERITTLQATSENESGKEIRAELREINETLALLKSDREGESITALLQVIINETGEDITITSTTYRTSDVRLFEISLSGVARDREALRAFGKRLESQEDIDVVNLPVSNFAQDSNIRFALTIEGHEK